MAIPAFPGAEGFGSTTPGGRGGTLYKVTNLNNSGTGSFRYACEAAGPRIVVFETGGTIDLSSTLTIDDPYITIAGQTAPGGGICIKRGTIRVETHDVIIRGLRLRPGDGSGGTPYDVRSGIRVTGSSYNVIIDHCSITWSTDTCCNVWGDAHDVTYQYCIISEPLHDAGLHSDNPHGYNFGVGRYGYNISIHHNLISSGMNRMPRFDPNLSGNVEFINNVIYNWRYHASDPENGNGVDFINNYYKAGPNTLAARKGITISSPTYIYVNGNIGPHRTDPSSGSEWDVCNGDESGHRSYSRTCDTTSVTIQSANDAYTDVLKNVGAIIPTWDSVDSRLITEVINGTGNSDLGVDSVEEAGGYPSLAAGTPETDSDGDGMPDDWENSHGLDPDDNSDMNLDRDSDGYYNIEEYINNLIPMTNLTVSLVDNITVQPFSYTPLIPVEPRAIVTFDLLNIIESVTPLLGVAPVLNIDSTDTIALTEQKTITIGTDIDESVTLDEEGATYILTKDIACAGTAFTITADSVTLDLNGFTVTYNLSSGTCYGVRASSVSDFTLKNGTIIQGAGQSAESHAVYTTSVSNFSCSYNAIKVIGEKCYGIYMMYSHPNLSVHHNYVENHGTHNLSTTKDVNCIKLEYGGSGGGGIYDNVCCEGHSGITVIENDNTLNIYNNLIQVRRRLGLKAPYSIALVYHTHNVNVYGNQMLSDEGRGTTCDGWGQGASEGATGNHIYNNKIGVKYTQTATSGFYPENNCYGMRDRYSSGDNTFEGNLIVIDNDTTGRIWGIYIGSDGYDPAMVDLLVQNNTVIARDDDESTVWGAWCFCFHDAEEITCINNDTYYDDTGGELNVPGWGTPVTNLTYTGNTKLSPSSFFPSVPTGLNITKFFDSYLLKWTDNGESQVYQYCVYRDGEKLDIFPRAGTFYVDVDIGGTHTYQVSALNLAGDESVPCSAVSTDSAALGWDLGGITINVNDSIESTESLTEQGGSISGDCFDLLTVDDVIEYLMSGHLVNRYDNLKITELCDQLISGSSPISMERIAILLIDEEVLLSVPLPGIGPIYNAITLNENIISSIGTDIGLYNTLNITEARDLVLPVEIDRFDEFLFFENTVLNMDVNPEVIEPEVAGSIKVSEWIDLNLEGTSVGRLSAAFVARQPGGVFVARRPSGAWIGRC